MKTWLQVALAICVCSALAFAAGTYVGKRVTPARVVTRVKVEYRDRIVKVTEAAEVKRVVVYRETTRKPDGTVIDRVSEHTDSDTRVTEKTSTDRQGGTSTDRQVTTAQPDWRIGVLVGGTLTPPALPLTGPLAVGLQVERRIIGPVSMGIWGLSSGQAGVSLSVTF